MPASCFPHDDLAERGAPGAPTAAARGSATAAAGLDAHAELEALADLRVGQITQWRNERLADVRLIDATHYGTSRALDVLAQPDSARAREIHAGWLDLYLTRGRFGRAMLLDADLNVRWVYPEEARRR